MVACYLFFSKILFCEYKTKKYEDKHVWKLCYIKLFYIIFEMDFWSDFW